LEILRDFAADNESRRSLAKEVATTIDKSIVRNPKDRFPAAGKLLAALSNPSP
jgi:hypothetical protein